MNLQEKLVEYRVKEINNMKLLQHRIKSSCAKNIFEWLAIVLFHNWKYTYICIDNPENYKANDQMLAFDIAKYNKNHVPGKEFFEKYVTTQQEFENIMKDISLKNIVEHS
ncbi:MAG: hypothetical protein J6D03_09710 [Clostridia bacterium]|nr:hypothetical protein [Clostridia bacterium]